MVPVCLASEPVYNVEEGLLPLLLGQLEQASESLSALLTGTASSGLGSARSKQKTSGRVLWQVSQQVLAQVPERWDEWWKR